MNKRFFYQFSTFVIVCLLTMTTACHEIDVVVTPTIELEKTAYQVKPERNLLIEPVFKDIDDEAVISWHIEEQVVGTEPTYVFNKREVGTYYLKVRVVTSSGTDEKTIRIDVLDLVPPIIDFTEGSELFIEAGATHTFAPHFSNEEELELRWMIGDKVVSTERTYDFTATEEGTYFLNVIATNADGEDELLVKITVIQEIPLDIEFPYSTRVTTVGRPCRIFAELASVKDVSFQWFIDGKEVEGQTTHALELSEVTLGTKEVKVVATKGKKRGEKTLTLEVVEPNQYYRPYDASKSKKWDKVYEFLPAPGQFVNEGYTANTMAEAVAYAESRLKQEGYVSLGAFGGYVILGFDHSIVNSGDYDFRIYGNSFDGSSEPGIVWVMQDENGDGIPNDTWYELKGSETGKPETIQDYEITYYRPSIPKSDIAWTDNQGNTGTVDWNAFHKQDSYYPLWVHTSVYTLRGTCLKARTHDQSGQGTYWVNEAFDWGYADNFSPIDRLTDDDNYNAGVNANHFKISHAIDYKCNPVHLDYIDFIKVQTGVNVKAGWLGENSTEVFNVDDYHPTMTRK